MEKPDQVTIQKSIEASLKVLETIGDPTVVNEAKKIEENVGKMVQINRPMVEAYAEDLKAFDQGLVAKYGMKVARVIEGVILVALAAKTFYLG